MAGGAGTWRGTGGMTTKLNAAELAMEAGVDMVITNGARLEDLYGIVAGEDMGTRFAGPAGDSAAATQSGKKEGIPMTVLETQGLAARHAARVLAVAGTAQEKPRAGGHRPGAGEPSRRRSWPPTPQDLDAARAAGMPPRPAGPAGPGRGPHRRYCGGGAAGGRPARPHRGGDQDGHPAQRPDHRQAPGAPGRHRHHLRGPAQRDGGRRRPLPQVGQRRASSGAARRPSAPTRPLRPSCGTPWRRPACPGTAWPWWTTPAGRAPTS